MRRHRLTDREWMSLRLLLPAKRRPGRPPKDHRLILDALLWLAKTGPPWRDLPERFGPWRTVATRFYRWIRSGLWDRILAELRRIADAASGIDWQLHMVDGTSVWAHRCAAGGKGRRLRLPARSFFASLQARRTMSSSTKRRLCKSAPWPMGTHFRQSGGRSAAEVAVACSSCIAID